MKLLAAGVTILVFAIVAETFAHSHGHIGGKGHWYCYPYRNPRQPHDNSLLICENPRTGKQVQAYYYSQRPSHRPQTPIHQSQQPQQPANPPQNPFHHPQQPSHPHLPPQNPNNPQYQPQKPVYPPNTAFRPPPSKYLKFPASTPQTPTHSPETPRYSSPTLSSDSTRPPPDPKRPPPLPKNTAYPVFQPPSSAQQVTGSSYNRPQEPPVNTDGTGLIDIRLNEN